MDTSLPPGCKMGIDPMDRSWILSALRAPWVLHVEEGSTRLCMQHARRLSMALGCDVGCPFGEFILRGASPNCTLLYSSCGTGSMSNGHLAFMFRSLEKLSDLLPVGTCLLEQG